MLVCWCVNVSVMGPEGEVCPCMEKDLHGGLASGDTPRLGSGFKRDATHTHRLWGPCAAPRVPVDMRLHPSVACGCALRHACSNALAVLAGQGL